MDRTRVNRDGEAVRVLIVDDHPMFLQLAQEVVTATPGFEVVGLAGSGAEALACAGDSNAQLVVMDVRMPGTDGVAAARRLAQAEEPPVVVLCSSDHRPDIAADPPAHGAVAFCCKERFGAKLLEEVWAAHGGAGRMVTGRAS
jgi:DNA-binding NarL/FixJ family response regulator